MPLAWVPYADRAEAGRRLGRLPAGLDLDFYRADGDALPGTIDEVAFYVLPYMKGPAVLERAAEMTKLQVVQTLTAGYEEFLPLVPPGVTLCNAAGLHDTSTAELAIALALASGRHLDDFARNQSAGAWRPVARPVARRPAGPDRRVRAHRAGDRAPAARLRGRLGHARGAARPPGAAAGAPDRGPAPAAAPGRRHLHHRPAHPADRGHDRRPRARAAAGRSPAGQRGPRQAGRHRRPGRRAVGRADPRGARRDRAGTPAARPSPLAPARGLDLTARRGRELGLRPARGPADRRAAEPFRHGPAAARTSSGPP